MSIIGYALSSEEHSPHRIVELAKMAEDAGFTYAFISDHYHPWIEAQGESGFVWGMIGAISQATKNLRISTGVTCPTIRIHPAIIAQASATAESLMPGRFMLGLGSGENLNEHILGLGWPTIDVRLEMLSEAIKIIRQLWIGGNQTYYGEYFNMEDARIYSLPENLPPILVAASGPKSAKLAGASGDGFINTSSDSKPIEIFEENGGKGNPKYGQITVSYDLDENVAIDNAMKYWPNAGLAGQLGQELRIPAYFEQAVSMVKREDITKAIVCGPDKNKYIEKIMKLLDTGYDYVYIHQVGPNQEEFFEFAKNNILSEFTQDLP
jgi:coenzyme F420-dependent glucose-6-phosphate dehydrogenase